MNGTCKDLGPLHDFLDRFKMCQPKPGAVQTHSEPAIPCSNEALRQQSWIEATLSGGGGIGLRGERSKYKSAYMKRNFTSAEAKLVYDHLTQKAPEAEVRGAVMAIGSYGEHYDGCYINYPDADMLAHDFWPQLYYGEKGLYPFLQNVKRTYDPNNVFHHAMSVRA
jgi:FAD/FMN-containing dehydrogenase